MSQAAAATEKLAYADQQAAARAVVEELTALLSEKLFPLQDASADAGLQTYQLAIASGYIAKAGQELLKL